MATAEVFFVRILIYGMVAIVPGTNGTTILLPKIAEPADEHKAYIAFQARCDGAQCGSIRPFNRTFPGLMLEGDQIIIGSIANSQLVTGSPAVEQPQVLPNNRDEATRLFWVPRMANILNKKNNTGEIQPECLKPNPDHCGRSIIGRAHFAAGKDLRTCQMISNKGFVGGDKVYAFDFRDNFTGESSWKQGLAEIIETTSPVSGDGIEIKLENFSGKGERKVTLKPVPCEGAKDTKCVDIYIANIPDISFDPSHRFKGIHFHYLYELLEAPLKGEKPAPIADGDNSRAAGDVQPVCRSVLTVASKKEASLSSLSSEIRLRAEIFHDAEDFYLMSPETRPICPMAMFTAPSQ